MAEGNEYRTLSTEASGEYRDRGSRFIAFSYPVKSEKEVKEILVKLKKEHPKANHHCYAFRLRPSGDVYRYSDDREPAGSAGKPIYGVLLSHDLSNVLIIVVRYFGGTLLGVPGLIQAYRGAASMAIIDSNIIIRPVTMQFLLQFGYEAYPDVMRLVKKTEASILDQKMGDSCSLTLEVKKSVYEKFEEGITVLRDGYSITKLS